GLAGGGVGLGLRDDGLGLPVADRQLVLLSVEADGVGAGLDRRVGDDEVLAESDDLGLDLGGGGGGEKDAGQKGDGESGRDSLHGGGIPFFSRQIFLGRRLREWPPSRNVYTSGAARGVQRM